MYVKKQDLITVAGFSLFFLAASIIGWFLIQQMILLLSLTVIVALITFAAINSHRINTVLQQTENNFRQTQALFHFYSTLKFQHPLPAMMDWAITPDFANALVTLVRERKPRLIVEAGSGISTIVVATTLQEIGEGKVLSLDHNKEFATLSAANLQKHGIENIASVVYAPLKATIIDNKSWLWYDLDKLSIPGPIDMLVIDGPPCTTGQLARYPALPILFKHLSKDAVIILDDAFRADEKAIVKRWLAEFTDFSQEDIDSERGITILRRQKVKVPLALA